jgi:hypothetical protein
MGWGEGGGRGVPPFHSQQKLNKVNQNKEEQIGVLRSLPNAPAQVRRAINYSLYHNTDAGVASFSVLLPQQRQEKHLKCLFTTTVAEGVFATCSDNATAARRATAKCSYNTTSVFLKPHQQQEKKYLLSILKLQQQQEEHLLRISK